MPPGPQHSARISHSFLSRSPHADAKAKQFDSNCYKYSSSPSCGLSTFFGGIAGLLHKALFVAETWRCIHIPISQGILPVLAQMQLRVEPIHESMGGVYGAYRHRRNHGAFAESLTQIGEVDDDYGSDRVRRGGAQDEYSKAREPIYLARNLCFHQDRLQYEIQTHLGEIEWPPATTLQPALRPNIL